MVNRSMELLLPTSRWPQRSVRCFSSVITLTLIATFCTATYASASTMESHSTTRTNSANRSHRIPRAAQRVSYPVGIANPSEPSGFAPPGRTAVAGFTLSYVSDFLGRSVPLGWDVFTGIPGGDPGGQFGRKHVVVSGGMLQLNVFRDYQYGGRWVTAGLCNCGHVQVYGAYFVRSRLTGSGPNEVQLLWPENNTWPPEIDFNETGGGVSSSSSTLHYGKSNKIIRLTVNATMTEWHTWGVVWSPTAISYLLDGRVWASINSPAKMPHIPMRLDLENRVMCVIGRQCPTSPVSMLVDWVAEYTLNKPVG